MAESVSARAGVARFGVFELDLRSGELRKSGIRIKLQDQPFRLLAVLLERPGELVTRTELKDRIWPDLEFGDFDHSVNLAVNKPRTALGDSADTPRFVETLHRRGYRFVATVEAIPASSRAALEPAGTTGLVKPPIRNPLLKPLLVAAAVLVVAVSFSTWKLWPRPVIKSVAVLPFTAGDPALQYLGDGIAETLTENLSQVPELHVLSRNSAFQVRAAQLSSRELSRRLGVRGLVMGTLKRRDDGALNVSVELLDGPEDRHIWGSEYIVSAAQLASAQPRIAQDVFLALRYRLDGVQTSRFGHRYTSNPEAYDAYLRGRFAVRNRIPQNLPDAVKCLSSPLASIPALRLPTTGLNPPTA